MKMMLALFFALLLAFETMADVRLPRIFGENMVFQRNQIISVWGWAGVNEKVSVGFNKQIKVTRADKKGKWQVQLAPEPAGGPFQLIVKGNNQIVLNNILIGEVWVCSGQSNMEMPIEGWGKINNYREEIIQADYPQIRQIKVPTTVSGTPRDDINGGDWQVCSTSSAGEFTAVGYFFARALFKELKVPIGLINTSWGGTHSETWTSQESFEGSDEFRGMVGKTGFGELETRAKQRQETMKKKVESLQGPFESQGSIIKWKDISFDDSQWPHMTLPGVWEQQGLVDLDGVVWFRKAIIIDSADAGKSALLELAKIDDIDETYINGIKVGSMDKWDENRRYRIPAGILKPGKNVIAVRVKDTGGAGGIYGEASDMQLTIEKKIQTMAGDWTFRVESIQVGTGNVGPNSYPSLLYNAMINPLIPFGIKGVIWYQGEANAGRGYQYRKAFPLMITDWRKHWGQGDFPFYFVQLSSWNANNGNSVKGSEWAELREAQTMTLALPHTGMAVTTDIGDPGDIHPKNKQDVGKRLASIALHNDYNQPGEYSGPMYKDMKSEGSKIILSFTHATNGFMVKDKYGYIKGFEIAGPDKQFHYARAEVEGNKIVVYQDSVSRPVAVRFGWADYAGEDNLYNKEGFPAVPFRTDNWKGITEGVKYEIGQ